MRCSTLQSTVVPGDDPCEGTATHILLGSTREGETGAREPFSDPVCEPCGMSLVRRPALKARIVPLHVYEPTPKFLIIEGHRLVEDSEHGERCFDSNATGSPTWFRFQTNGCPGRPESITVLRYSREFLRSSRDMAEQSARLWWDYAVDYLHTPIEDWRTVTGHAQYSAYFTFRDREYGVRHDLPAGWFGAEKLPNRGWPAHVQINSEYAENYRKVLFHFHDRFNRYESSYFATYTPGREDVVLHAPDGAIRAVLRVTGLNFPESTHLAQVTVAVCEAFGAVADLTFQTRVYGETA
ncbi:hypothetical protein [Streptomyces sp. NPDC055036]